MKKKVHRSLDELFMMECLTIAQKGAGSVSPNPMVGAVIVKSGKVVARGYHRKFGGPHAEVDAVRRATGSLRGATLYVNLEPCNIFGKTPPCTDLVIKAGFARVVVGMVDPNPRIAGRGIKLLRAAGIAVETGILEEECRKLNESFSRHITTGLPFVTLKIAQTLDGRIADLSGYSRWITGEASRTLVHALRAHSDAVLIGGGTLRQDDPLLTVREVKGRTPVRVILSPSFEVPAGAQLFRSAAKGKIILFTTSRALDRNAKRRSALEKSGVEIVTIPQQKDGTFSLLNVLSILGERGIASLLVEGGAETFSRFLEQRVADKILCFIAPKVLGPGTGAFAHLRPRSIQTPFSLAEMSVRTLGNDLLVEGYIRSRKK